MRHFELKILFITAIFMFKTYTCMYNYQRVSTVFRINVQIPAYSRFYCVISAIEVKI